MASKNIKGITIEIGGNTTKLQDALKSVDKQVNGLNSDLKALNQALKLDPKNTELLAQKQDVLARNINATNQRLATLKEAQRQMGSYTHLTDEQKTAYNRLSLEIANSENALKSMNKELKSMNKLDLSGLKDGLKKCGEVALDVTKVIASAVGAISVALGKLVKDSVSSYASLEQNIGGVETLFKDSADKVLENARNAYRTAGVSANEYMAGVTSFSASLLQSLGGNTEKAADVADMAFRDMSDNANKFGTSMDSIQHAYQGFAKQNYTMLDNLKLGYGGTKTEMQRLLKDAQKLTGIKYNINNLSDVYNAIHVIQESLGVTGTTAEEAEKTITGSLGSMKSAFDNFLNGSGGVEDLATTINNFLRNVLEAIKKLAPDLIRGVVQLFRDLIPTLSSMAGELLPIIIDGAKEIIQGLITFINNDSEQFVTMAVDLLSNLAMFILDNLPILLEATIKIIAELAKGLSKNAPKLIPAMVDCLLEMVDALIDNLDLLVDASIELILALADGLIDALPRLIEKAPEIVEKLANAIINNAPKIMEAGWKLTLKLIEGVLSVKQQLIETGIEVGRILVQAIKAFFESDEATFIVFGIGGWLIKKLREGLGLGGSSTSKEATTAGNQLGVSITNGASSGASPTKAEEIGKNFVDGINKGVSNKTKVAQAVTSAGNTALALLNKAKSILKINSPSKATEEIGEFFDLGLKEGIDNTAKDVVKSASNLSNALLSSLSGDLNVDGTIGDVNSAMRSLNNGIESSLNPVINPTANTNPLYITIDKFYNNRETDIQQLAQEMEFYRKNSALAKGGM